LVTFARGGAVVVVVAGAAVDGGVTVVVGTVGAGVVGGVVAGTGLRTQVVGGGRELMQSA
jgi:hypothetical protein